MNRKKLEELASAHALGALNPEEAAEIEALAAHDSEAREEIAAFADTAAAFAAAASPRAVPDAALRARILAAATEGTQAPVPVPVPLPPGFGIVRCGSEGWTESGIPGFRFKLLSGTMGVGAHIVLAELGPGAKFPEHDHDASEGLYVLSGDLQSEGQLLGAGDFLRAEPGTHHHDLVSPSGCVALVIMGEAVLA
jgi:anti-sigma factor ChrR (cupin superfamily)